MVVKTLLRAQIRGGGPASSASPPVAYRYLLRSPRAPEGEALEDHVKPADAARGAIVWEEDRGEYYAFPSQAACAAWYEASPAPRFCHEVILGARPQRLKFDVDAPAHKLDALSEEALARAGRAARGVPELPEGCADVLEAILGGALPDAPGAAAAASADEVRAGKARAIVDMLIEAVLDELYVAYYAVEPLGAVRADLAVTDNGGPEAGSHKYSYHLLVVPFAVADHHEAQEFTERVLERLPEAVRRFVDPDVNKSTQNFRMLGSSKPSAPHRVKLATAAAAEAFGTRPGLSLADAFVAAPPGLRVLARVYTDEEAAPGARAPQRPPELTRGSPLVREALALAAQDGASEGHRFTEARGTLLCFARERPTHCALCGEVHRRDNSLMLAVNPSEGGGGEEWPGLGTTVCTVVEHCRQRRGASRLLGEIAVDSAELRAADRTADREAGRPQRRKGRKPPAKGPAGGGGGGGGEGAVPPGGPPEAGGDAAPLRGLLQARVAERVEAIRAGRVDPHDALRSEFEALPEAQRAVYSADAMRPYELVPTLAVLAQMKLGKTKALRAHLAAHFGADALEAKVVRIVSFRQTFSRALHEAFPDYVCYSDVVGDITPARHPRAIVQCESLHRLRMPARPAPADCVVLDEVESILAQLHSGLHKHLTASFAMFRWLVATARHVVVMDANLSDRTFAALRLLRPQHPPLFHWNQFPRARGDAYAFTADQGAWLGALHGRLREGKRVVIPTNALGEARGVEAGIRRLFPGLAVMLYSGETSTTEKREHFGDVATHWGRLDVLIYTPTCSAGVSFELEHFDCLFGLFTDMSCDVETCRQMLGRVRNLAAREHVILLRKGCHAAQPTAVADIRRLMLDKRAGLRRRVEDDALHWQYGTTPEAMGAVEFYESDYFRLWLENRRILHLSQNDFARRFIDQVADTGAAVRVLEAPAPGLGEALASAHRTVCAELREARCAAVAAAPELAPGDAAALRDRMQAQLDVAPDERLALERYQLAEAYDWHGRPISAAFVAAYQKPEARRVYRNLCRITERETVAASLRRLRDREADAYDAAMSFRGTAGAEASEIRDLLRDRTGYTSQSHSAAVWLLGVCGFDLTSTHRVREEGLEARLRGALPALGRCLDLVVFDLGVPRPDLPRLTRETDRRKFLTGILRFVNAVLRAMYGAELRRTKKEHGGDSYVLGRSAVGRLFVLSLAPEPDGVPGGPRPHVPSRLVDAPAPARVDAFLEDGLHDLAGFLGPGDGGPGAPDPDSEDDPDDPGAGADPPDLDAFLVDILGEAPPPLPSRAAGVGGEYGGIFASLFG